jgi:uncharacterized protein (TIGR02246 family)
MPARKPEQLDELFAEALNSGKLDALVALYEPQATLSPQPRQFVTGTKPIREALSGFLAMKPKINLNPKTLAMADDIAFTSAKWELTGTAPDGKPVNMAGQSAEIARRQPDGTWLFLIDSPWGLEG